MADFAIPRLLKAQLGAIVATGVDFSVMVAITSGLTMSPVLGTVVGASCGALSNFYMGRHWIFAASSGDHGGQALRYTLVSAASLGLNALGEWLLAVRLGIPYVLARAMIAVAVSLLWNYPLHRHFVFAAPRSP
jgi:putative flippase GtrA